MNAEIPILILSILNLEKGKIENDQLIYIKLLIIICTMSTLFLCRCRILYDGNKLHFPHSISNKVNRVSFLERPAGRYTVGAGSTVISFSVAAFGSKYIV